MFFGIHDDDRYVKRDLPREKQSRVMYSFGTSKFLISMIFLHLVPPVPVVIMPMFNKYEPLPDGALKTKIHELAAQIKYPVKKLFVMDGSKRSSHSNAFMFGFGNNKRIGKFNVLEQDFASIFCYPSERGTIV